MLFLSCTIFRLAKPTFSRYNENFALGRVYILGSISAAAVRETIRAPPRGTGERRQLSLRLCSTFGHIWVMPKIRKHNLRCKLEFSIFCHCVSMRFTPSRPYTQRWQGIMGTFHMDLLLAYYNLVEAGSCSV